jgi:hypothetical protein
VPNYLIRLRLPDRPGALGAVASRIGSVGADVVSIDILQRERGVVIDELGVGLAGDHLLALLRDEILEVDGVVIESIRALEGPVPDRYSELLDVATALFKQSSSSDLFEHLVVRVRRSLFAGFAAVLDASTREVVASDGDLPETEKLATMVGLAAPASATGRHPRGGADGSTDEAVAVAVSVMERAGSVLVVGRREPVLRDRERQWISIMAELADHRGIELS